MFQFVSFQLLLRKTRESSLEKLETKQISRSATKITIQPTYYLFKRQKYSNLIRTTQKHANVVCMVGRFQNHHSMVLKELICKPPLFFRFGIIFYINRA